MDVQTNGATEAPSAPIAIDNSPLTIEQAASQLWQERHKDEQPAQESAPEKPAQTRAPDGKFAKAEADTAQSPEQEAAAETPPSGEAEGVEAETPPIEPPRSWTAEQREKWSSLPREAQEIIAERENARDAEVSRRQNETAEQRKALEAKQTAVEQERLRAEQAVTNAALMVQAELARDFPDIKTHEDAAKLAQEDPFRWAQWKQRVDNLQILAHQANQQQQERKSAEAQAFTDWASEQDTKFSDRFKDFADPVKAEKHRSQVMNYLQDTLGFTREEVQNAWNSRDFRDHRFQEMAWDAARFRAAQEKAKAAVAAPKPPVQRPGTASRQSAAESTIAALQAELAKTHSVQDQLRLSAQILRLEREGKH